MKLSDCPTVRRLYDCTPLLSHLARDIASVRHDRYGPIAALSLFYKGVSEEEARAPVCRSERNLSFPRVRAVRRWLWSSHALWKGTGPARGLSRRCKTVVRRASCGLLFVQSAFTSRARVRRCARCLLVGRLGTRARAVPRWFWSYYALWILALHQRKASPFRCKTVVRRSSFGLQHRTAGFRVARARAPLR